MRARGVGEILDTAMDVLARRLVFCVLASTALWFAAGVVERLIATPVPAAQLGTVWFRDLVGTLFVDHLATALVVLVVYGEMQGYRVPARTAVLLTLKRLPAIVAYMGLTLVLFALPATCLVLPFAIDPTCVLFGFPIVGGFWVILAWLLGVAPAALVLERLGPLEAARRSSYLVSGSFWRWVGLKLVQGLLVAPIAALPSSLEDPSLRARFESWLGVDGPPAAMLWLVVTALFVGIGTALSSVVMTIYYLDARVRTEGLDLRMRFERIEREPAADGPGAGRSAEALA